MLKRIALSLCLLAGASAPALATTPAPSVLGNTPLEIHARFPAQVYSNLTANVFMTSVMLSRIHTAELPDLARAYLEANGSSAPLLPWLKIHVAPIEYNRVAAAFAAVGPIKKQAVPTTDMTLGEIYFDFRTSPTGSLSPMSALSETTIFAGSRLIPAYTAGYAAGTVLAALIQKYCPELWDAIGGSIDNIPAVLEQIMQGIIDAAQAEQLQGDAESSADGYYQFPITESGDFGGDFEVSASMQAFYDAGGSPDGR